MRALLPDPIEATETRVTNEVQCVQCVLVCTVHSVYTVQTSVLLECTLCTD